MVREPLIPVLTWVFCVIVVTGEVKDNSTNYVLGLLQNSKSGDGIWGYVYMWDSVICWLVIHVAPIKKFGVRFLLELCCRRELMTCCSLLFVLCVDDNS